MREEWNNKDNDLWQVLDKNGEFDRDDIISL